MQRINRNHQGERGNLVGSEDQEIHYAPMDIDSQSITLTETNEKEIIRLIQQYLMNHGYGTVAESLQQASNVLMEDTAVNEFRDNVLAGNYTNLSGQISQLSVSPEQMKEIEYFLYEQQYLELMEKGQKMLAIQVLQKELAPRTSNKERLHQLAQLIMCSSEHTDSGDGSLSELRRQAHWKGSEFDGRKELLDKIQTLMPSTAMLQPNRLEQLIKQSIAFQVHNCKFHNVYASQYSLLDDHRCSKQLIPQKCIAVLNKHKDEVWQVKFSPSGKKLASMGKDNMVCLWSFIQSFDNQKQQKSQHNIVQYKYKIKCTHEIRGHAKQINSLHWTNTDDRWIITGSSDQTAKIWDSKTGKQVLELAKHLESVQSAVFSQDDTRIITIAVDKQVILWEIRVDESGSFYAQEMTRLETKNYLDLAFQGTRFVCMGQTHFQVFDLQSEDHIRESFEDSDCQKEFEVSDTLTSISLSKDGRYLLANMSLKQPKIELWDLNRKEVVHRFRGHSQEMFIIRCSFGGVNEGFVVCGSEDSVIYLWSKEKGDLIAKIEGHTQVINAVHWNPTDPYIFASASDDQTIRIWGLEEMANAEVVIDSKEIKRIETTALNGMNGVNKFIGYPSEFEDDDDEDDEEHVSEEEEEEQIQGRDVGGSSEEDDEDWAEGRP